MARLHWTWQLTGPGHPLRVERRPATARAFSMPLATLVLVVFVSPNLLALLVRPDVTASTRAGATPNPADLVVTAVLQTALLVMALLPIAARRRLDRRLCGPGRHQRVRPALVFGVMTGIATMLLAYATNAALNRLLDATAPVRQQLLQQAVQGGVDLVLAGAIAVVLAPIAEEIVFRGVVFRAIAERYGTSVGIIASATVFASIHIEILLSQPVALVALFLVGAALAWSYARTGWLLVPVVAHATFNAGSLALAVLLDRLPAPPA